MKLQTKDNIKESAAFTFFIAVSIAMYCIFGLSGLFGSIFLLILLVALTGIKESTWQSINIILLDVVWLVIYLIEYWK